MRGVAGCISPAERPEPRGDRHASCAVTGASPAALPATCAAGCAIARDARGAGDRTSVPAGAARTGSFGCCSCRSTAISVSRAATAASAAPPQRAAAAALKKWAGVCPSAVQLQSQAWAPGAHRPSSSSTVWRAAAGSGSRAARWRGVMPCGPCRSHRQLPPASSPQPSTVRSVAPQPDCTARCRREMPWRHASCREEQRGRQGAEVRLARLHQHYRCRNGKEDGAAALQPADFCA